MLLKTLFLLSLDDIDKLRVYFNNLTNCIITSTGRHVPVIRRFGHSFLLWNNALQSLISESFTYNPCFFTETKLRRLYRRFGYLLVSKLRNLLERASHEVNIEALEYLTKYYE